MKRRSFLATVFMTAAFALSPSADAAVISVNFVGGQGTGGPGAGTVTAPAGAVLVGNWNNATGPSGNLANPIMDVGGVGAANVNYNSPNTWAATNVTPPGGGSATMMSGYLDNFGGQTITVTGLSSAFTGAGYSVLVYFHEDSAGSHGASIADNLGNTDSAFAFQAGGGGSGYPLAGPGGFIASTSTNSATTVPSNYILLEGLRGSNFTITGVNGTTGDGRTRPNGFQIVANAVPEPGTFALLGTAAVGLLARRRRQNA